MGQIMTVCVLVLLKFYLVSPMFESSGEGENNIYEEGTEHRDTQAAQSDGYTDGGCHPNSSRCGQPMHMHILVLVCFEDGTCTNEADAGKDSLNDMRYAI